MKINIFLSLSLTHLIEKVSFKEIQHHLFVKVAIIGLRQIVGPIFIPNSRH